jgi:hypothetical protein
MRRSLLVLMLFVGCHPLAGCGGCGGVSESDMRKYAQRRSAPENEPTQTAAADAKAAVAAGASPAKSDGAAIPAATPQAAADAPQTTASDEPPPRPVTEAERRARSIANLEKIGKAIAAYTKKHGRLPVAGTPRDGELLLSWRVLILPELGYPELAARFRGGEPWNGPTNKLLLEYVPPEFQSPERFDTKTNYLGVTGRPTIFPTDALEGISSGLLPADVKDGIDNTLAVVEVDDKYSVEWTRPVDYLAEIDAPGAMLGGLRGEGAFGVLASGRVVLLPRDLAPSRLSALFTAAGGEPIGPAKAFLSAPTAEPPPPMLATTADDPAVANQTAVATDDPAAATAAEPMVATPIGPAAPAQILAAPYAPDHRKRPVPDEESLARSRELLRQLYGKEFEEARTRQERQKFLAKLLAEVPSVEQNASDLFELARIARGLAVSLGDARAAFGACEVIEQAFQIDPLPMRLAVLDDLSKQSRTADLVNDGSGTSALDEADSLVRQALDADRFDIAIPAQEALVTLARAKNEDRSELARRQQRAGELEAARLLHQSAQRAVETLKTSPADPAANEAVGRYLCFVKDRWEAGLPFLAKAADIRLRGIASLETASDRSAASVLALADQYWELAAKMKQPQRRGIQLRAVYCYELAGASLANSLEKVKTQRRIEEAVSLYGREEVERILAPLRPKQTVRDEPD